MRLRTGVFVSLMTAAMLLSLLAPLARAFIPEPYELYGAAKDDMGVALANGSPIRSFIDGVDYSNKTSVFSRPGFTDGYFDIDTYGNHRTNGSDPGTPWIKEGGDDNEPIMYTWGDFSNNTQIGGPAQPWLQGMVFQETHNWATGLPPQTGDLMLAPVAEQPMAIKIFSITTTSSVFPFTDYVWLCNPYNQIVDASKYYLQKDILGDPLGPQVQVPAGNIPPYSRYFVDLGDINFFNEAGDNIKLVWKNTPGPTAPFGGNDIIVDRVEYNSTSGGALNWEPGNTIMGNELAPGAGQQINRSMAYGDTNSLVQDFWLDNEIRPNDPPYAPDPVCMQGLCTNDTGNPALYHITVRQNFPINWTHLDKNNDPQVAAQIYIRDTTSTVWTDATGAAQQTTYDGLELLACHDYWLGVSTKDAGIVWGPVTELMFHTNCNPAPVNREWPSNLWTTAAKIDQQVWWSFMTDNDPGDTLNYTWKVALDPSWISIISTGTTQNNYSDPFQTAPDTDYFWCVDEEDGWGTPISNCGAPWIFMTEPLQPKPTATDLRVDTHALGDAYLQRVPITDPVRDPVLSWTFGPGTRQQTAFHIQVYRDSDNFQMWDLNNTGIGGDLETATYNSDSTGTALSVGVCYYFQVKVRDNLATQLWSDWATPLDFCINTPPPVPTLLNPPDDSSRLIGSTTVSWNAVVDADTGDTITYDYCIDTNSDTPVPPTCSISYTTAFTGTVSNAFTTTSGNYRWLVRSYDQHEYSAWSGVWNFTAYATPPNTDPTIDITAPTAGERLKQGSTYTITWTMSDAEDTDAELIVSLSYRVGTGSLLPIVLILTGGAESYQWTVPTTVESNAVTITAIVTDTGLLTATDTSAQFEIYKEPEPAFPLMEVLLIIIVIVVVLAIVLVLVMKRKKKKPEEEAAPPAEEAPVEEPAEEEIEEEAPAPPPKAAPKPAAAPAATKAPSKTKECPSCGTIVSATDKECFMCGAKL